MFTRLQLIVFMLFAFEIVHCIQDRLPWLNNFASSTRSNLLHCYLVEAGEGLWDNLLSRMVSEQQTLSQQPLMVPQCVGQLIQTQNIIFLANKQFTETSLCPVSVCSLLCFTAMAPLPPAAHRCASVWTANSLLALHQGRCT